MRQLGFDAAFSMSSGRPENMTSQSAAGSNVDRPSFNTPIHQPIDNLSINKPNGIRSHVRAPCGSLTELRVGDINPMNPSLLLPLLASVAQEQRWLMWLSARSAVKGVWSDQFNHSELPIMHMTTAIESQWLLALRAVSSGNHHVCIEWQGNISDDHRRLLKSAAEKAGSHLFLITRQ